MSRLLASSILLNLLPWSSLVAQPLMDDPPFAGAVALPQTIEASMYYTDAQSPADPTLLEFTMDDGSGTLVKTSPYWPEAFLTHPELIPVDATFVKSCDMKEVDSSLDTNGCVSFDTDGDGTPDLTNCPSRHVYLVNGFLASITFETNNPRRLDPNLLFLGDPDGPVDPPLEPPLVVISTPATEGSAYQARIDPGSDFCPAGNPDDPCCGRLGDPCCHPLLRLWAANTAIWNTVNLHGVSIAILDPWTGGNRALHDILAYYVATALARSWFDVDGKGPIPFTHGGSWSGGMSKFAATLHPHILGAFSLAGIFDVDEFANHVDNSVKRHGTLGLGNVKYWDGPNTNRHLGLHVLSKNLVELGVESFSQWMSPMHQTQRLDAVLYWLYGGGDFSTDPYGPNVDQIEAKLAALGKDHLFTPVVRDFAGHGFTLTPNELYPFLKELYWHWLDVQARGGPIMAAPFSADAYTTGENPLYVDNLHQVPDAARSGSDPGLISSITSSAEDGVMVPGRLEAIRFFSLSGSDYFVMGAGDGRLRLYQIGLTGSVTLIDTTESQGYGTAGLMVDGDAVVATSAKGNFRAYRVTGAGASAVLTSIYEHNTAGGRRFGDYPRLFETTLPFFAGEAIFAYGYAPYLGQDGFGAITVLDAADYDTDMTFPNDPISFAMPIIDDQGRDTILMATPRGYAGTLDPTEPWVIHDATPKLKLDKISDFIDMRVIGGLQRSLDGAQYIVLAGDGEQQMIVLDDQLRILTTWNDPNEGDPQALVASATDSTFYARHGTSVSRFELQDQGGTPTLVRLALDVITANKRIEGLASTAWNGETLFVATALDSFQVVSLDPSGSLTVHRDTWSTNESHFQALDCPSGTCFTLNREDGKIYRVKNDLSLGAEKSAPALSDGTTPFNFLIVNEKTGANDYFPTINKAARLVDLDTGTFGDRIAYDNSGFVEVYQMPNGGCLFDETSSGPPSIHQAYVTCDPLFTSSQQIVIDGGSMDHNIRFYETQGTETIVITGATGFVGVFKKASGAASYSLVAHENLLGRSCHALDARVDNGQDIFYTGCDTEGESGGSLVRWRLDCSAGPCSFVEEWRAYTGTAPTAIRWLPGGVQGCPEDRLTFADFAGSLYVLDGDSSTGPGALLVKSESLEGGGPGAVSGLFHERTFNGMLVEDVLRFSTPARRYAVTLTTDCGGS